MKYLPLNIERKIRGLHFRLTRKLPQRCPEDAWPGIGAVSVALRPFAGQFGNVKRYELMILCAVAKHTGARRLFEFGTFDGLTTWHLAANTSPDARLWTIDLPLDHPARFKNAHDRAVGKIQGVRVGAQFLNTQENAKVEQLFEDTMAFNPERFRGQIDFCFIDAGHGYLNVCRDSENALQMVRPGGTILWHDYSRWWPGVQKCLDTLNKRLPLFVLEETALAGLRVPC